MEPREPRWVPHWRDTLHELARISDELLFSSPIGRDFKRNKYVAGIREALETILGVEKGTLSNIFDDPDHSAVLKMTATIEPLINEMLFMLVKNNFNSSQQTAAHDLLVETLQSLTIDRRRRLLLEFKFIDERSSKFIQVLFHVRNHYAHHVRNSTKAVTELCREIAGGSDKNYIAMMHSLTWWPPPDKAKKTKPKSNTKPPLLNMAESNWKYFAYTNFLWFLVSTLKVIDEKQLNALREAERDNWKEFAAQHFARPLLPSVPEPANENAKGADDT